jgi:hypothetical protein
MLLTLAHEINDNVVYGAPGWRDLRDKYLKLRDKYTGEHILAPYILLELSRRDDADSKSLTAKHAKLIADHVNELNDLDPHAVEDLFDRCEISLGRLELGTGPKPKPVREVSVGGAKEVDIASRYYREKPKPKTWDEERARRDHRGRHYKRGGTAGRKLPGSMAEIKSLLPRLNRRQRVVYQGMVLDDPPRTRADIARELGINHPNQVSEILLQAQTKMNKWLLAKEQKTK